MLIKQKKRIDKSFSIEYNPYCSVRRVLVPKDDSIKKALEL